MRADLWRFKVFLIVAVLVLALSRGHLIANSYFFMIFHYFSDFLGRLQPSTTTIQKTLGTPGVDKSRSPREALHSYTGNSSRGRMRAELWRPKVFLLSSHYYLGSLSWTSRTFYFPDSRDLLEVLGGLSWQRERERERDPTEDPLGSGRIP